MGASTAVRVRDLLIVDDDPIQAYLFEKVLRELGSNTAASMLPVAIRHWTFFIGLFPSKTPLDLP